MASGTSAFYPLLIIIDIGIGATSKEVLGPDGKKSWVNPLVQLGGKMSYSKGRMGREFGDNEWKESTATMGYRD